jgi:hypothetical protein
MIATFLLSYWVADMAGVGSGESQGSTAPMAALISGTPTLPTSEHPQEASAAFENELGSDTRPSTNVTDQDASDREDDAGSSTLKATPNWKRAWQREKHQSQQDKRPVSNDSARFGDVRIATPGGWAEVYHRGRKLASHTPTTVRVPVGRQTLELRFQGGPNRRRVTVTVYEDRSVAIVERAP